MLRLTLRTLLGRRLRLALTGIAVILGVALVSGTLVLTDTTSAAFRDLFGRADAGVDAVVRSQAPFTDSNSLGGGRAPLPASLLAQVRAVPGVRDAVGGVAGYAQVIGTDGKAITPSGGAPTIGVSVTPDHTVSTLVARAGRLPARAGEVAVDVTTATQHHIHVGDHIRLLVNGPTRWFRVVGTVRFGGADGVANATLVALDLSTAQQVMNRTGQFDEIRVAAGPGVSQATLRDRIARAVGGRYQVLTGQAYIDDTTGKYTDSLGFVTTALFVFAAIALLVGSFIIFNTFGILVAQRTRELALLRAVGASTGQVTRSVLVEAAVVGVVASALGLGLGVAVAVGLQALFAAGGMSLPDTSLQFQAHTVVWSLVVGVGVTLAAALVPARRTRRIPPVAAMRDDAVVIESHIGLRRVVTGAVTAVIGVGALMLGVFGSTGAALPLVGLGALLTFVAAGILAPLVARPATRVLGWPLARALRFPGAAGRQNAMRNPLRTSRTSAALMVGVGLVTFFTIVGASLRASIGSTIDGAIGADYIVNNFGAGNQGFSPAVADRLRALPQVGIVSEFRFGSFRDGGGTTQQLQAIDTSAIATGSFHVDMVAGSYATLDRGGVLVSQQTANADGLHLGSRVAMTFARTGTQRLPVVGLYDKSRNTFVGDYLVGIPTYARNYVDQEDSVVAVMVRDGVRAADAGAAIHAALRDYPQLRIDDRASLKAFNNDQIDQMLGVIDVLLALAVVIALVGIVNALALSVIERTRELGLLRAVGMTRGQVRRMVVVESTIVAVLGACLGVAVGSFFGWAAVRGMHDVGVITFAYPVSSVAGFVLTAAVAGLGAGLLPARRAARIDVLRAIATA